MSEPNAVVGLAIANAVKHKTDEGGEGVLKFCTQIHVECIVQVVVCLGVILIGFK